MRQSVAAPCPIDHGGGFCSAVCGRARQPSAFLPKRRPLPRVLVLSECRCNLRRTAALPAGKYMPGAPGVLVPRLMRRARSV
ncbi:hypothetical protein RR48_08048 [Papilio machaon]|uniref:Uncharacterized protein n=1 Tax=Papilio machaon TaxID=76193 RepID=A0A194R220_PAPMA|nr:hypothetical protein RR48_08048 [Papilio machaon]